MKNFRRQSQTQLRCFHRKPPLPGTVKPLQLLPPHPQHQEPPSHTHPVVILQHTHLPQRRIDMLLPHLKRPTLCALLQKMNYFDASRCHHLNAGQRSPSNEIESFSSTLGDSPSFMRFSPSSCRALLPPCSQSSSVRGLVTTHSLSTMMTTVTLWAHLIAQPTPTNKYSATV